MADLTLYFPSSGAAAHNCAYSDYWQNTTGAGTRAPLNTSKGTSAMAVRYPYRANGETRGLGQQWVSAAMAARDWTTSDTFDVVMQFRDDDATSCTFPLGIRIFNAAGDTEVGVLYEGIVNSVNWTSTYTSRFASGVSLQNDVSMPENGHLVIEIGMSTTYAASFNERMVVGESTSGATALSLNNTDTNTDHYPYIAFTYGAPPVTGMTNDIVMIFEC